LTTLGRSVLLLLERQGLAVLLVLVGLLWATGMLPFRVCESAATFSTILEGQEKNRELLANAILRIGDAVQRMDTRDSIRTCSLIADKEARVSCLKVVGVLLWLAEKYIPMDDTIKTILRAVVMIVLVLWLLQVFGLLGYLGAVHTPVLR
jgi:hypothetical protein